MTSSFSFGDFIPNFTSLGVSSAPIAPLTDQERVRNKMSYDQRTRYDKVNLGLRYSRDKFYLLDVEKFPDNFKITVSGSSRNIYHIIFDEGHRTFRCNCPDGAGYCSSRNVLCKHSCFVLYKVLKVFDFKEPESTFLTDLTLRDVEYEKIYSGLMNLFQRFGSAEGVEQELIQTEFLEKYKNIKTEMNSKVHTKTKFDCDGQCSNEMCSICFSEFEEADMEQTLKCPSCNNNFHKECIVKWLKTGRNTCALCRSPVWEEYKTTLMMASGGQYHNLGYFTTN